MTSAGLPSFSWHRAILFHRAWSIEKGSAGAVHTQTLCQLMHTRLRIDLARQLQLECAPLPPRERASEG